MADKGNLYREACQAKDIKLLSDLYLDNGFMAFNNISERGGGNLMFLCVPRLGISVQIVTHFFPLLIVII